MFRKKSEICCGNISRRGSGEEGRKRNLSNYDRNLIAEKGRGRIILFLLRRLRVSVLLMTPAPEFGPERKLLISYSKG